MTTNSEWLKSLATENPGQLTATDSREKLERDIDAWLDMWIAWSIPKDKLWLEIIGWLDRQTAITECECIDTRVNFAERIRLYQKGYEDGRHARGAASFPQHHEDDSREKLEADALDFCTRVFEKGRLFAIGLVSSCDGSEQHDELIKLLNRQAAITQLECAEEHRTRLGELHDLLDEAASERELLRAKLVEYKHSHPDAPNQPTSQFDAPKSGETAGINASKDDMGDFDDSREKLEADVLKYYTHTTSTLMWPDDANIKKKWVSVSMDTVLEWLDRAADIRECEFFQQYCAECETAENAALKSNVAVLREELAKLQAENDKLVDELKETLIAEREAVEACEGCKLTDELRAEIAKRDKGIERLKARRDEWKEKALHLEHRLNIELVCSDKSIIEALESANRELDAESARLKAERDYWRQEVQYCMNAAYPPSHAPERSYSPGVMGYPDRDGCTTPSTMVSAVIHGLRDEKMDEWKGVFEQLSKAEAERDRYRELASELLDSAHNMQLIADRGLA